MGCGHSRIDHDRLGAHVFAQVISGIEAGRITPHPPAASYRDVGRLNAQLDKALGRAQFDAIVADGLDWQTWTSVRRRNFLNAVITRIEIRPYPLRLKRSPARPKNLSREEWLQRDIAFWNMMAPWRIRIVY